MQAITTKYLGPTNTLPSRIKARVVCGRSVTVNYDHGLRNAEANHIAAAKALRDDLGWKGRMLGGGTDTGYVFVFVASSIVMEA